MITMQATTATLNTTTYRNEAVTFEAKLFLYGDTCGEAKSDVSSKL